jgi:hypothetical protein
VLYSLHSDDLIDGVKECVKSLGRAAVVATIVETELVCFIKAKSVSRRPYKPPAANTGRSVVRKMLGSLPLPFEDNNTFNLMLRLAQGLRSLDYCRSLFVAKGQMLGHPEELGFGKIDFLNHDFMKGWDTLVLMAPLHARRFIEGSEKHKQELADLEAKQLAIEQNSDDDGVNDDDDDSDRDGRGKGVDGMGPIGEEGFQVSKPPTVSTPAHDQGSKGEAERSPGQSPAGKHRKRQKK